MPDLDYIFKPDSVAIIGASPRELTIGHRIMKNLIDAGYKGEIYPVNPSGTDILGIKSHPSILDVEGSVDLAHIVIKNVLVPEALEDCGKKGVKVCIINTAGFKETGDTGAALEKRILEIAKSYNIRLFGPNCQGIINNSPEINAYCNFTFSRPRHGKISVFTQSGGVGEVICNRLSELGAGLNMYASSGNSCDIDCAEILQYWADDPGTSVIICHVESVEDEHAFFSVVEQVAAKKPVLGLFAGKTVPGAKAVKFHTGGVISSGVWKEPAIKGLIPIDDIEGACQAARAFESLSLPKGNRVAVITNTGGTGVIAADELVKGGCDLPETGIQTSEYLKEILFSEAIVSNPIDILATAGPEQFEKTLLALINDKGFDFIMLNFITPFFVDCKEIAKRTAKIIASSPVPVAVCIMTDKVNWAETLKVYKDYGIPVFDTPEATAKAMCAMIEYFV